MWSVLANRVEGAISASRLSRSSDPMLRGEAANHSFLHGNGRTFGIEGNLLSATAEICTPEGKICCRTASGTVLSALATIKLSFELLLCGKLYLSLAVYGKPIERRDLIIVSDCNF
jgi:hypothetical protein